MHHEAREEEGMDFAFAPHGEARTQTCSFL